MNFRPRHRLRESLRLVLSFSCGVFLCNSLASAVTFKWNTDSNGGWNSSFNWTPFGVPDDADDAAVLGTAISGPRTVFLSSNTTVGSLTFDSPHTYTLNNFGSQQLTLDAPFRGDAFLRVLNGDHVMKPTSCWRQILKLILPNRICWKLKSWLQNLARRHSRSLAAVTFGSTKFLALTMERSLATREPSQAAEKCSATSTTVAQRLPPAMTMKARSGYWAITPRRPGSPEVELGGTAAVDYDRFTISGSASLDGDVRVLLSSGFVPSAATSLRS